MFVQERRLPSGEDPAIESFDPIEDGRPGEGLQSGRLPGRAFTKAETDRLRQSFGQVGPEALLVIGTRGIGTGKPGKRDETKRSTGACDKLPGQAGEGRRNNATARSQGLKKHQRQPLEKRGKDEKMDPPHELGQLLLREGTMEEDASSEREAEAAAEGPLVAASLSGEMKPPGEVDHPFQGR